MWPRHQHGWRCPSQTQGGFAGRDRCRKANFSGFSYRSRILSKTISRANPNFGPLPGETAQFGRFASNREKPSRECAKLLREQRTQVGRERGRLRAEHKSLPEGGAPRPLPPPGPQDPRSRPPCVISSHLCDSTTKEAPSDEHPAPWGRTSTNKEMGTERTQLLKQPQGPQSLTSLLSAQMAAALMARLSLCPALAPPRGLTIPLTPEDKHIKLLGLPSAPGDSRHRLRPVPEGPVPEEVRTAATLDCQLLLAVIGVTDGDRCGPVDPVTGGREAWRRPGRSVRDPRMGLTRRPAGAEGWPIWECQS